MSHGYAGVSRDMYVLAENWSPWLWGVHTQVCTRHTDGRTGSHTGEMYSGLIYWWLVAFGPTFEKCYFRWSTHTLTCFRVRTHYFEFAIIYEFSNWLLFVLFQLVHGDCNAKLRQWLFWYSTAIKQRLVCIFLYLLLLIFYTFPFFETFCYHVLKSCYVSICPYSNPNNIVQWCNVVYFQSSIWEAHFQHTIIFSTESIYCVLSIFALLLYLL